MAKAKMNNEDKIDIPVEQKLKALFELQQIDSKIDRIRIIRGELPLEVQDLEDEVLGLETRVGNYEEELKVFDENIIKFKNQIKESEALIKKYEGQQNKVRNNREFDSLTKEIEFQKLEIQLCEKRIKENKANIEAKTEFINTVKANLEDKKSDLNHKKTELDSIVSETQKEEEQLVKKSKDAGTVIEERLIIAYNKVRNQARNGLAVVAVDRDACGGCFNKIPPQRQLDIRTHKKIIVCEYCGRILVDANILEDAHKA
jgi:predicted  nucleic acid-binding Zn-ribbon protein